MGKRIGVGVLFLLCCLMSSACFAERIALVIGNSKYEHLGGLKNPANDAPAVAKRLAALGFTLLQPVQKGGDHHGAQLDLSSRQFAAAKAAFMAASAGAEVALFYYAGHGTQLRGGNAYILPVDTIKPEEQGDLEYVAQQSYPLQSLMNDLDGKAKLTIAVFDACRDIPDLHKLRSSFSGGQIGRGLSRLSVGNGQIVAYAGAAGQVVNDGFFGAHSPYTKQLLKVLDEHPAQEFGDLFRDVATRVKSRIKQDPVVEIQGVPPRAFYLRKPEEGEFAEEEVEMMRLMQLASSGDVEAIKRLQKMAVFQKLLAQKNEGEGSSDPQMEVVTVATEVTSDDPDRKALAEAMRAYMRFSAKGIEKLKTLNDEGNVFAGMMLERSYRKGVTGAVKDEVLAENYLEQKKQAYQKIPELVEANDEIAISWLGNKYRDSEDVAEQKKAVEIFSLAAERGVAYAQAVMGGYYESGNVVEKNNKKAVKWYEKSANQGVAASIYALARMYEHGKGVTKDEKTASELYRDAAKGGELRAFHRLGGMYGSGRGVPQDYKKAMEWYKRATNQGSADAMNSVGVMYVKGEGVEKDEKIGVEWYRKAAEAGDDWGQSNLAYFYKEGKGGLKQDYKQALKWYKKSAEQSLKSAMTNVGFLYERGLGTDKNLTKAFEWYEKGAKAGSAWGQRNLANLYKNGQGVEQDYDKAREWYLKASEQNYANAMTQLGHLHKNGLGVEKDEEQAFNWYKKAAEAGDQWGQYSLASIYQYTKNTAIGKNYKQAMKWYLEAAEQGHVSAMSSIGYLFSKGLGTEKAPVKAVEWYSKAAKKGNKWAQYSLAYNYLLGVGVKKNEKEARKWFKQSAENGYSSAQYELAKMLYQGQGGKKSRKSANQWLKKAAEQGHKKAKEVVTRGGFPEKAPSEQKVREVVRTFVSCGACNGANYTPAPTPAPKEYYDADGVLVRETYKTIVDCSKCKKPPAPRPAPAPAGNLHTHPSIPGCVDSIKHNHKHPLGANHSHKYDCAKSLPKPVPAPRPAPGASSTQHSHPATTCSNGGPHDHPNGNNPHDHNYAC